MCVQNMDFGELCVQFTRICRNLHKILSITGSKGLKNITTYNFYCRIFYFFQCFVRMLRNSIVVWQKKILKLSIKILLCLKGKRSKMGIIALHNIRMIPKLWYFFKEIFQVLRTKKIPANNRFPIENLVQWPRQVRYKN